MQASCHSHVRDIINKLESYSNTLHPYFPIEVVHRVRTTYKKLRVVVALMKNVTPHSPSMRPAFSKYYKLLGRLRNVQLLVERLNHEEELAISEVVPLLIKKEQELVKQLKCKTLVKVVKKWKYKNEELFPRIIPQRSINVYLAQIFERVEVIANKQCVEDSDLHAVRTLLKDAQNLAILFGHWENQAPNDFVEFINDLGTYHDMVVQNITLKELMPCLIERATEINVRKYTAFIEEEIEKRRESLVNELIRLFGSSHKVGKFETIEPGILENGGVDVFLCVQIRRRYHMISIKAEPERYFYI